MARPVIFETTKYKPRTINKLFSGPVYFRAYRGSLAANLCITER